MHLGALSATLMSHQALTVSFTHTYTFIFNDFPLSNCDSFPPPTILEGEKISLYFICEAKKIILIMDDQSKSTANDISISRKSKSVSSKGKLTIIVIAISF